MLLYHASKLQGGVFNCRVVGRTIEHWLGYLCRDVELITWVIRCAAAGRLTPGLLWGSGFTTRTQLPKNASRKTEPSLLLLWCFPHRQMLDGVLGGGGGSGLLLTPGNFNCIDAIIYRKCWRMCRSNLIKFWFIFIYKKNIT